MRGAFAEIWTEICRNRQYGCGIDGEWVKDGQVPFFIKEQQYLLLLLKGAVQIRTDSRVKRFAQRILSSKKQRSYLTTASSWTSRRSAAGRPWTAPPCSPAGRSLRWLLGSTSCYLPELPISRSPHLGVACLVACAALSGGFWLCLCRGVGGLLLLLLAERKKRWPWKPLPFPWRP